MRICPVGERSSGVREDLVCTFQDRLILRTAVEVLVGVECSKLFFEVNSHSNQSCTDVRLRSLSAATEVRPQRLSKHSPGQHRRLQTTDGPRRATFCRSQSGFVEPSCPRLNHASQRTQESRILIFSTSRTTFRENTSRKKDLVLLRDIAPTTGVASVA